MSRFTITNVDEPVSPDVVKPVSIGRFTIENVPDIWTMNMIQGRIVFSNLLRGIKNIPYKKLPPDAIIQKKDLELSPEKPAILLHAKPGHELQHEMSTRPLKNMHLEYKHKFNARTARNKARVNALTPQMEENARRITRSKKLNNNLGGIDEEAYARIENPVRPTGITNNTWGKYTSILANHKTQHANRMAKFAERQAQYAKKGGRKTHRRK